MSITGILPVTRKLGLFGAIGLSSPEAAGLSPNPQSENWLCFFTASPASHSSQLFIHTPLILPSARPQIGFVWRISLSGKGVLDKTPLLKYPIQPEFGFV